MKLELGAVTSPLSEEARTRYRAKVLMKDSVTLLDVIVNTKYILLNMVC